MNQFALELSLKRQHVLLRSSALSHLSFECLVPSEIEKNSFLFFSIHFERFTLSLIVQLTSINRAENEKFGEIWLISQNTRIPSLEWCNFSFSLFYFLKKSVNRMCARKKLEIESYERQESATVQAKKAVNLNAYFLLFFFLSRTIQDSGLVRTRSLQMLIFHEIPEIPLFEFPRRTQGKKNKNKNFNVCSWSDSD